HSLERSKPSNTRCQYGSLVRWLSIAAPIAGTCDDVTPAMILATALLSLARFWLGRLDDARPGILVLARPRAVAVDRTAAAQHHVGIILLGRAGHQRCEVLERMAVAGAELGGEVDVAAQFQQTIILALEDRLALLGRELRKPLVEVFRLVVLERLAVLRLHQRHAEHVEMVAAARAVGVEHVGAGDVVVILLGRLVCWHRRNLGPRSNGPTKRLMGWIYPA